MRKIETITMEVPYCDGCGACCLQTGFSVAHIDLCAVCYARLKVFTAERYRLRIRPLVLGDFYDWMAQRGVLSLEASRRIHPSNGDG